MNEEEKDVIVRMIYFCEENWAAFVQRMEESGYEEDEVEKFLENIKKHYLG